MTTKHARGEKHYLAKLTEKQVKEIRQKKRIRMALREELRAISVARISEKRRLLKAKLKQVSNENIAKEYGIHEMTLAKILRCETWYHVHDY